MSRIEKLNPASFKNVSFLVKTESTDRGQKIAIHEYPNRDRRFVEPLGKIPPIFTLNCIIHDEDFFERRLDFERVLELPGLGELIHPIYGSVQVQVGPFTVSSNQRRIGEFIFNVTFYASDQEIIPTQLPATEQTISNQAKLARESLDNVLESSFEEPIDGIDLADDSSSMLGALDSIQDSIESIVNPIQSAISEANSQISTFRNKIFKIMQTASSLKESITGAYNSILQITLDIGTLSTAWDNLLDFNIGPSGNTSDIGPTNTVKRARTENNKSIIDEHTRLTGLIGSFESISFIDFSTDDDLKNAISKLDDRFNRYIELNFIDNINVSSLADDPDFRAFMMQLRIDTKSVLNLKMKNVWNIVDIEPGKSSMALTTYRFYGDLLNIGDIIDLNPLVNVANINGTIKAVTK